MQIWPTVCALVNELTFLGSYLRHGSFGSAERTILRPLQKGSEPTNGPRATAQGDLSALGEVLVHEDPPLHRTLDTERAPRRANRAGWASAVARSVRFCGGGARAQDSRHRRGSRAARLHSMGVRFYSDLAVGSASLVHQPLHH